MRELLTLAMLISLDGADPQVKGHVRANLNVGNDRASMLAVITQLLPFVGYPRTLNALRALDEIAPANRRSQSCRPAHSAPTSWSRRSASARWG
jgi:4-carboxymuconolactone decarboxylase